MYTVLTTVIIIDGVVLALAALILLARHFVLTSKPCAIHVNDREPCQAHTGSSLMATLVPHDVFLPSSCGGKGTCGTCRVQIVEGGGRPLATETAILSRRELRTGTRLGCQIRVRGNLRIAVAAEGLAARAFVARVAHVETLTADLKRLVLHLPENSPLLFTAGQYLQISHPAHPHENPRAYSIASPPSQTNAVELHVRFVPGGLVSPWLHTRKAGDELRFSAPHGRFAQDIDPDAPLVFLAGGVGLAPVLSLLAAEFARDSRRSLTLYFGARTATDLYEHRLLSAWVAQHGNFRYIPAISEPTRTVRAADPATAPNSPWLGERGMITDVFARSWTGPADATAIVCGPPGLIAHAVPLLRARGFTDSRIHVEDFAGKNPD